MVPFGDPHSSPAPFEATCTPDYQGEGRWVDAREWVYEFDSPLPAGVQCTFTVRSGLTTLEGEALRRETFRFSTGGPAVRQIMPPEGFRNVDEEQIFVLILDGPVEESSVFKNAFFTVDGLASPVQIELIEGETRSTILENRFPYDNMPEYAVLIRGRQRFPTSTRVALIWGEGIRSPSGVANQEGQSFQFETRAAFTATVACRRENPDKDCIPLTPIMLRFSAPIARADAEQIRLEGPPGAFAQPQFEEGDWVQFVQFDGPFPPLSRFTLHIPAGLTDDAGRPLVNADRFPFETRTDEYPPLAKFAADFGIIEEENPVLPVTVRNLESTLNLDLWEADTPPFITGSYQRIEPDETLQMVRWMRLVQQRSWEDRNRSVFEAPSVFQSQDFALPRPGSEKSFEVIGIPLPGPGFYVVELESEVLGASLLGESDPMYVPTTVLVTGLGVHLKWGFEKSLVWVTSLAEGKPVEGAVVEVRDCEGALLAEGKTDGRGLLDVKLPTREEVTRCGYGSFDQGLLVSARIGEDLGLVHSEWTEGIEPWRFQLETSWRAERVVAHTILDRTLVRAGETIHMRHVVRQPTSNGFEELLPSLKPNQLVIRHMGSDQSFEFPLELDELGIGISSWEIPQDARLGLYAISLTREGGDESQSWSSGSFRVEEFRIPFMKAALRPPAEELVQPSRIPIDLSVEYLAGGAASGLPVRLRYRLGDVWSPPVRGFDDFRFVEGKVTEGIVRSGQREEETGDEFHLVELRLDETGSSRLTIEDLPLVERPRRLTAELEYRDPNGEVQTVATEVPVWPSERRVGIKVDDWVLSRDSIECSAAVVDLDGNPVAGAPVNVQIFQRKTFSHRKRLVGGFYAYEHFTETRALGEICRGETDENGLLECSASPPVSGNVIILAETSDPQGREAVTHRGLWIAGEDNWFAVGDDDRIDLIPEQERYEPGDTARFQIRIPFRRATALVTVEREGVIETYLREITAEEPVIEIPIQNHYAPNVFVSALVVRGRVQEAPATAMADPGKPAYKLGIVEVSVGWKGHELDVGVETDKNVYRPREEVSLTLRVNRADSQEPAANGELAVAVVDEGLLELMPNETWQLLEAMMRRRSYGVTTATAQMHVVGKRHFGLKAVPSGGGGGSQSTRELFDTLILWEGRVSLDEQGHASLTFPLNDSVTRFRIAAIATEGLDRFGFGSSSVRSNQDLVIFSGISPVVREGDRVSSRFTIRNAGEDRLSLDARASIEELSERFQQQLTLGPGESQEISWLVDVPVSADSLTYLVEVFSADGIADRLSVTQEVVPREPVRVQQSTLVQVPTGEEVTLAVALPSGAIDNKGGIETAFAGSLVAGLDPVREFMDLYPYTCLEQRVSRAVALNDVEEWTRLREQLPYFLDQDGLLKYFPSVNHGSEVLTSYLLSITHERGWEIPESSLERMLNGLRAFVEGRIARPDVIRTVDLSIRRLMAIESLSRYEAATANLLDPIRVELTLWPTAALIDYLNVLHRVRPRGSTAKIEECLGEIRSRLNLQGTTLTFGREGETGLWWLMNSPDVNAVRLVLTLLETEKWMEEIPRLVRGALNRTREGHWDLTTANAWGVLAVEKFALRFEAEPVTGTSTVSMGGLARRVRWSEGEDPTLQLSWAGSGSGTVEISHGGSGNPWAVVSSKAAISRTEPVSSGYQIQKEVIPVEQRRNGVWSVGDVLRVRLTVDADTDRTWVVVADPIPAGAIVLGSGLNRDSAILIDDEEQDIRPAYQERSFEAFRSYYSYLPAGQWTIEYTLRLNTEGRFYLPSARVEALYSPEVYGELPASIFEVQQ